ncbi:endonuclease III [Candidatus Peregrinibacteria bacterium]|nr:endonuclease III [Candidatus Peregrinibacteria bacterium]
MAKAKQSYKLTKKSRLEARKRLKQTLQTLRERYPNAHCELDHSSPFQLLVATILSAQCTDKRVNMVTPALFARFPDAEKMAKADLQELETMIRSTGFYRNKAKNIKAAANRIVAEFGGEVPDTMRDLLTIPGAARKTANVVLWNAFGKNEGVVVDTQVGRIAFRLGWTEEILPVKIEKDLMEIIPRNEWGELSHLLIFLGRDVCKAPKPICGRCSLIKTCPWYKEVVSKEAPSKAKAPKTHSLT